MRMKRAFPIAAGAILAVGVCYCRWVLRSGAVFATGRTNAPNRAALVAVRDGVKIGAPHSDVLAAYWQLRTPDLRLRADEPTKWFIGMPLEFGARDWVLGCCISSSRMVELPQSESAQRTVPHQQMGRQTNSETTPGPSAQPTVVRSAASDG